MVSQITDNYAVDDQSHARIELSRFDIDRILHFAHPIPVKHGWHQRRGHRTGVDAIHDGQYRSQAPSHMGL